MRTPPQTNLRGFIFFCPLSYKFIVLGLLGPFPFPISFGFGLQFVTLQYLFIFGGQDVTIRKYSHN